MIRPVSIVAAAIVLAAAGAGCGGSGSSGTKASSTKRHGRTGYRWLVPTSGPQPTVAQENAQPGTRAWRLPGPPGDVGGLAHGTLAGYVSAQAVSPGQTERIYVNAAGARRVRIGVFRMGWYRGLGGREVLSTRPLRAVSQPGCTHRFQTGLTECNWRPALSFRIPSALPSGVYIAKLTAASGQTDCLFVVRSSQPQPLLAQLPTSTYEAYNAWGGDSLYPGGSDRVGITGTTQGIEVSYDRPYDSVTGAGQFFARDVAMVRFLERYGYPVSYTTSESVDQDPTQLNGHKAVVDFGHSEYWSQRQYGAFSGALAHGTNLLFFGSDTLAWRVRYAPASSAASDARAPDHSIVAYKEHASLDPNRSTPTGVFPDAGAALADSAYLGCITPRLDQPGPPTYRYYTWSPSASLQPAWLFNGTGVTASTRIPGIVGYETDQTTRLTPRGTLVLGSGAVPCQGAEAGEPTPRPGQDLAQTTLYTAPSGAFVFDTGTLGWEFGLEPVPSASPDVPTAPDPRVVAMTRNVLDRALR